MPQRMAAIGVAIIAIILAIFAFTQQQNAANHEATAIAQAQAGGTAQSRAEAAQQTAVLQMNTYATAQAQAEATRAAAELSAQQAADNAVVALAAAAQQADSAAQAQAAASQQAATAFVYQEQLTADANQQATQQSLATSSAATAAFQLAQSALEQSTAAADGATSEAELAATAGAAQTQTARLAATATAAQGAAQATVSSLETQVSIPTTTPSLPSTPAATVVAASDTSFPVPVLSQQYTTQDGKLTFSYPADWQILEAGGYVSLYSNISLEASVLSQIPSGEMGLLILQNAPPGAEFVHADTFLKALTDSMATNFGKSFGSDEKIIFGAAEALTLAGHDAFGSIGTSSKVDLEVLVYFDRGAYIVVVAVCAPGEVHLCEPTLIAVAETVQYHSI